IELDYYFKFSGFWYTWNEWVLSQKGAWIIKHEPRWEYGGTDIWVDSGDPKKPMRSFVLGKEIIAAAGDGAWTMRHSPSTACRLFRKKDWSDLDAMVSW
ncbi:MAG: hypothetical protein ACYS5V_06955, partial [Planctomycetota bacterium]